MSVRSGDTFSISFMMRMKKDITLVALKRRRSEKHFFNGLLYRENLP